MALAAIPVIQDLAVVLVVALGMAVVAYLLRQPLVIGYILAGIIIGPYTPPFSLLTHPEVLNLLAEIGIVFLLFAIGLDFPIAKLRSVGRPAIVIALTESLGTFFLGFVVALALGLPRFDSLFLGLAISVTSTVILSRILEELGVFQRDETKLVLGIAVVEDIIVVSVLAVLQSLALTGSVAVVSVGLSLALVGAFIAGTIVLGSRSIPRLVDAIARTERTDLLVIGVLAVAFGLSIVASLIGISVATGAFLAGVLVAESKSQPRANALVTPLKSLFGAIFFVSMGALMNIGLLPAYVVPISILLATAYIAKYVLVYVAARGQRLPPVAARRAASSFSALGGELALVVAKGGADVGITSPFVLPMIGTMTLVTAFLSPYIVRIGWSRFVAADRIEPTTPPEPG
ncbi:MAG: cation:proton antiporter [Thermoplasmata archaeon]|nr:cation:proton antiporter [Thermoplasmata archaeon]